MNNNYSEYSEFKVFAARDADINYSYAWIYASQLKDKGIKRHHAVKITNKDNHKYCYLQCRTIDKNYIFNHKFLLYKYYCKKCNYTPYCKKTQQFCYKMPTYEDNLFPKDENIIMLSEHYREILGTEKYIVADKTEKLKIQKPLLSSIYYDIMAVLQHPELYARVLAWVAIISLFLTAVSIFDYDTLYSIFNCLSARPKNYSYCIQCHYDKIISIKYVLLNIPLPVLIFFTLRYIFDATMLYFLNLCSFIIMITCFSSIFFAVLAT